MIRLELPDSVLFARAAEAHRAYCKRRRDPHSRPGPRCSEITRQADGRASIVLRHETYGIFVVGRYEWDGKRMARVRVPRGKA